MTDPPDDGSLAGAETLPRKRHGSREPCSQIHIRSEYDILATATALIALKCRTIRKTFLLEGETVTMKYVKQLCGEERYGRMIEDAKKKFFADPTVDLCYPTPAGYLTIWFQLA